MSKEFSEGLGISILVNVFAPSGFGNMVHQKNFCYSHTVSQTAHNCKGNVDFASIPDNKHTEIIISVPFSPALHISYK